MAREAADDGAVKAAAGWDVAAEEGDATKNAAKPAASMSVLKVLMFAQTSEIRAEDHCD